MTEKEMTDLELARLVRDLDDEMKPDRDLWQGIERQMLDHPQKASRTQGQWMPVAVAASLVIAVGAMMLSLTQNPSALPPVGSSLVSAPGTTIGLTTGLNQVQAEYVQVRNPLVEQFNVKNESLDERTRMDLYQNLEIMAQARRDLESQIRDNPANQRLMEMLVKLHEQEIALLQQDFSRHSQSL
jgi:hypothetical protein